MGAALLDSVWVSPLLSHGCKLQNKRLQEKVISSNIMKIPDLNLPDGSNTHQVELSDEGVPIELMAPISGDGTHDLNLPDGICETNSHQVELSDEDASVEFTAPISRDGTYNSNLADGICQTNMHQMELSVKNVTAPISGDGAIVPGDTENLLFEQHRHQVEVPAQDAHIGFKAPISRNVDHANGVANVAVAIVPANTEKLLFEKNRDLWAVAESVEACRTMPQDPHFLPLKSCRHNSREGQALGYMVTFDNIARRTLNLRLDAKREAIEDDVSLLEELETHGFHVAPLKNCLNKTLLLKNEQDKFENLLEQTKRRRKEHDEEKCKNKEKRANIEERMKELQKDIELAAKMEKDREAKIADEHLVQRVHGEELHKIKIQLEELVASLLH
ncbi:uncharacterized protein LOC141708028 isoform X2 [Apium graveolens]|uniref:uncharacterized protein LOC141708028 isoform X2 n=1 Tax=Apium graveolens TaxID=4045 RepID=UPI003D7A2BB8